MELTNDELLKLRDEKVNEIAHYNTLQLAQKVCL